MLIMLTLRDILSYVCILITQHNMSNQMACFIHPVTHVKTFHLHRSFVGKTPLRFIYLGLFTDVFMNKNPTKHSIAFSSGKSAFQFMVIPVMSFGFAFCTFFTLFVTFPPSVPPVLPSSVLTFVLLSKMCLLGRFLFYFEGQFSFMPPVGFASCLYLP